jgi:hypothetical protein
VQGTAWDFYWQGYWFPYFSNNQRYRVTGNVTAGEGSTLTAASGASLLFTAGASLKTPTASGSFRAAGSASRPVCFLGPLQEPYEVESVRGIKVSGDMTLQSGGGIKLY